MSESNGSKPRVHQWVAASVLQLDTRLARQATKNGQLKIISKVVVDVLDVYCEDCRKVFREAIADEPCQMGPQHFGGPRKQPDPTPLEDEWPEPHDPLGPPPGQLFRL